MHFYPEEVKLNICFIIFGIREHSSGTNSFHYFHPKLKDSSGKHLYIADMKGTSKGSATDQGMEKTKNILGWKCPALKLSVDQMRPSKQCILQDSLWKLFARDSTDSYWGRTELYTAPTCSSQVLHRALLNCHWLTCLCYFGLFPAFLCLNWGS